MIALSILGALLLIAVWVALKLTAYGIRLYNNLVTLKNDCNNSFASIGLLMKQRMDELPKLIGCCQGYMGHEHETLKDVMAARAGIQAAKTGADTAKAEGQLHTAIGALFATVEAYPNLKADEMFQHLQDRISILERDIADKRLSFNGEATAYNTRITQWPDSMIAKRFSFGPVTLLKFDTTADDGKPVQDVDVSASFAKG